MKKRKTEIVFDSEARRKYLIGFHKRKVERQKKAEKIIKQKERNEKLKMRKEIREKKNMEIQNCIKSNPLIAQAEFLNLGEITQGLFENLDIKNEDKKHNIHISQNKYDQNYTTVTIIENLN
ncbi:hypothetical protein PCANB_001844 [Pneumocystis canis]|nr:hypothetical protein PCANB_001844 [Pneumocystis canis]